MKTIIAALTLAALAAVTSLRAAPMGTAFTYQGKLADDGVVPTGTYDLRFRLFDALTGGAAIGTPHEINLPSVAVSQGLFTVSLDFGAAFEGSARWLEIWVAPSGGTSVVLSPRQELTPTPYALFAGSAAGVSPGAVGTAGLLDDAVTGNKLANGAAVRSLNGLTEAVTLAAGPHITLGSVGNVITVSGLGPGAPAWLLGGNGIADPAAEFLGTTNDQPLWLKVNNTTGWRLLPGAWAPSIIGGHQANSLVDHGGSVIAGGGSAALPNRMEGGYHSFIGGGEGNRLSDQWNVLVGGYANLIGITGFHPAPELNFLGSGKSNRMESAFSVLVGGDHNQVIGHLNGVLGGNFNFVNGTNGVVVGGGNNSATNFAAAVGGARNAALGSHSFVGGGGDNSNHGGHSAVVGGSSNTISSLVLGGFIGGGIRNSILAQEAVIPGGRDNSAHSRAASIGGGDGNLISSNSLAATIAGGRSNVIQGVDYGPQIGIAQATSSLIAGGERNLVSGAEAAAILGGKDNSASGHASAALAGERNAVDFAHSVVSGQGAVARASFSVTHGAMFAQPGDGQCTRYAIKTTTTGNVSQLLIGPRPPTGSAIAFHGIIGAKAFGDASAAFEVKGLIRNYGGVVALVGTPTVTILARDTLLASATVSVVVNSSSLAFQVQSGSTLNVRWVGNLDTSEVTF